MASNHTIKQIPKYAQCFIFSALMLGSQLLQLPVFAQGDDSTPKVAMISPECFEANGSKLPSMTVTEVTQTLDFSHLDRRTPKAGKRNQTNSASENLGLVEGARTFTSTFQAKEASRLAGQGVTITGNPGGSYFHLEKGNVLFSPENNIVVGTHDGDIYIGAGASVFVMNSGHDVAIYDLYETKPGQVSAYCGETELSLEPGRMLLITKQDATEFEKVEGVCRSIGYRRAASINVEEAVDESVKAFVADFSIPSAVNSIETLKTMLDSKEKPEQTTIANILRSSIASSDVTNAGDGVKN